MTKDGSRGKEFVELARHECPKINQSRSPHPCPFGVCAGKADKTGFDALADKAVKDRLLAAHDIRAGDVALRHAGKNADVAWLPGDPDRGAGKSCKIARKVYILRLLPSLRRAGHAADQHRNITVDIQSREIGLQFGPEIGRRQPAHPAVGATLSDNRPPPVQRPDTKRAGAPVDKDDVSFVCHAHILLSGGIPPDFLALQAKAVNRHFHHIALLQEHGLRLYPHADTWRRAGRDHVTWMQCHQL